MDKDDMVTIQDEVGQNENYNDGKKISRRRKSKSRRQSRSKKRSKRKSK